MEGRGVADAHATLVDLRTGGGGARQSVRRKTDAVELLTERCTMPLKRICLMAALAWPAPAVAQDGWEYTASLTGWFSGVANTVDTPVGEIETELDFEEVLDLLDVAFFGSLEARHGRWSLVADAIYVDLSTGIDSTSGAPDALSSLFTGGEVSTQTTLVSAYASYAVVDDSTLRFDVGGGVRYNDVAVDTRLVGEDPVAPVSFDNSDSWADLLIAARVSRDFSDRWYGVGYVDGGGFGLGGDSSDLTWQALGGVGFRFNDRWSTLGGYRYLSIDRALDRVDIVAEVSGPFLGVQASF